MSKLRFEISEVVRVKHEGEPDRIMVNFLLGNTHSQIYVIRDIEAQSTEQYTYFLFKEFEKAMIEAMEKESI